MARIIAIIPARGGSKGLPRKNLQPLGGIPLVAWTIRAAKASQRIETVYVSTESTDIAKIAASHGATVINRPVELARDETLTLPVVEHVISQLSPQPEIVVVLQCTSPLTTAEDIDLAIDKLLINPRIDAVISVVEDHGFIVDRHGICTNIPASERSRRRQDRTEQYRLNGAVSVLRTPLRDIWECSRELHVMPVERSVDIDGPVDLAIAEALLKYQNTWIVLGSGPDAPEALRIARRRHPGAPIITTNDGILLFEPPDVPDIYFLSDTNGCIQYAARAMDYRRHGTKTVTLDRLPSALKARGVEGFDEFMPIDGGIPFQKGATGWPGLSGLFCVQYALNYGAKSLHLLGMNGYRGVPGDHFQPQEGGDNEAKRVRHTKTIIQPFFQAAIEAYPEVEFIFYGELNYAIHGKNVIRRPTAEEVETLR